MPNARIWDSLVVWLAKTKNRLARLELADIRTALAVLAVVLKSAGIATWRAAVALARATPGALRRAGIATRHEAIEVYQANRWRLRIAGGLALVGIPAVVLTGFAALLVYTYYSIDLPDHRHLAQYEPPASTLVDADGGERIAEFATENREFLPIESIPPLAVQAFLAAEDKNFFGHTGIDALAVTRAAVQNLVTLGENRRPVGASTITQQVAKRFFLTNEISFARKIKEMILAFRLERDFSKEKLLELYLNDIYLGRGAYGLTTAAKTYFGKPINALSLPEFAYLAALPKAPNNYNAARYPAAAKARRDWVIAQMARAGLIEDEQADEAAKSQLGILENGNEFTLAGYFTEEVRRELITRFGEKALYTGGLAVHTTLDTELQAVAERALRDGLIAYDRRHGWRGPLSKLQLDANAKEPGWAPRLAAVPPPLGIGQWQMAVVLAVDNDGVTVGLVPGTTGRIHKDELKWARPALKDQTVGPVPRRPADVLTRGDVVLVEAIETPAAEKAPAAKAYGLRQVPEVSGAIVAMDPHTGGVYAMSGGYQFERNRDEFNRAVQARRQPGSAFKPFVYLTALNNGFTPSTGVSDDPVSIGRGAGAWSPANYDGTSLGVQPMRVGLEKSRNTMTVRIAERLGPKKVAATAERFGVANPMPTDFSMVLGSAETTLLKLTTAYAQIANGGVKIAPQLIDWVRDRHGNLIFDRSSVELPDADAPVDDERSLYQLVTMLRGVIERGTAGRARSLGNNVFGKTGTTNDEKDAWFIGFTTDIVVGVYVGFDQPRTLGPKEQGASVALPIFIDFMKEALKQLPAEPYPVPRGIVVARVRQDGGAAEAGESGAIAQPYKVGTVPQRVEPPASYPQPPAPPAPFRPPFSAAVGPYGGR
jgi:penicillin-binding protein 1A